MTEEQGLVVSVAEEVVGDELATDYVPPATTLALTDAVDFDEDGGTILVGEEFPEEAVYTSADLEADVLVLAVPLAGTFVAGEPVKVLPEARQRVASVQLANDDGEAMVARVPHALYDRVPEGTRDVYERVVLTQERGEWVVADVLGKQPLVDGSYIDPDTIPPPVLTDGEPPEVSPTPTVLGGVGVLHVRWEALINPDPVTYEVHLSTADGFAPSPATLAAETDATSITLRALPDGTALAYGPEDAPVVYYVRLVAKDPDPGTAPPSTQGSGSLYRVGNAEISAEYGYFGTVNAAQITTGTLSAEVTVSGQVKTSDTGQRVVMDTQGLHLYTSANDPLLDLPTDPSKPATFVGNAEMGALDLGSLLLRGAGTVGPDGSLELAEGVTAPGTAPSVTLDHEAGATPYQPQFFGNTTYSTDADVRDVAFSTTDAFFVTNQTGDDYLGQRGLSKTPVDGGSFAAGVLLEVGAGSSGPWAVEVSGSDVWVASKTSTVPLRLTKYNASDLSAAGVVMDLAPPTTISYILGMSIVAGFAYVGCVEFISGTSKYQPRVIKVDLATGVATVLTSAQNLGSTVTYQRGFAAGTFDYGDGLLRYVYNVAGIALVFAISSGTSLTYRGDENWALTGSGPFAWHPAGHFRQVQQTMDMLVPEPVTWNKFTGIIWTTATSSKWYASYAWRDSVAGFLTPQSPLAPFTMLKRYRLRLTGSTIPAGDPDAVAFYLGRGDTAPSRTGMWLQALPDVGANALTLTSPVFSGTNPQETGNFPTSGGATLKSAGKRLDQAPKTSINGVGAANIDGLLPPGSITMFAGATAPPGWVLCDGSALNTATAPDLFAAIGYTFGGSGTTFNVPNMKDRQPMGVSTVKPLGEQAGSGSHSHNLSDSAYAQIGLGTNIAVGRRIFGTTYAETFRFTGTAQTPAASQSTVSPLRGSTDTANHIPPYLAVNFIIKL